MLQLTKDRETGVHGLLTVRPWARRGSERSVYAIACGRRGHIFGITLHRREDGRVRAVSLLAPLLDGVPLQIVAGDWWRAERRDDDMARLIVDPLPAPSDGPIVVRVR
jgi:hypothetical protein